MLSPGKWHQSVPRDATANVQWRLRLYERSKGDRNFQRGIRSMCAEDILFYLNAFAWTYNPRLKKQKVLPFITWGFQEEMLLGEGHESPGLLWCIENDEDVLIEKSREMGASWLCLYVIEWMWHFHPWNQFLCISRNEDAVDKPGDPDSLFWKIDHHHRYQPDWLMPVGWEQTTCRKKLFYENPETHSTITGQASTGKAGVGGRATAMFIDEFSQIKEDREVQQRTSDTTGCRIFNGTHRGMDTAFYQMSQREDMKILKMHWTQHPEKQRGLYRSCQPVEILDPTYAFPADYFFNMTGEPLGGPFPGLRSPWYDKQCPRKDDKRAVAMDLDINPRGTVSQFFDALTIKHLVAEHCTDPLWAGVVHFDRDTANSPALVPVADGALLLWLHPTSENRCPVGSYAIGGDISTGQGATPSCLSIINCRTGEKVGEYASALVDPKDCALVAVALARLFRDEDGEPALLIWEAGGGPGGIFGAKVIELGYRRVYMSTREYALVRKQSDQPGWIPSAPNKRHLLEDYRAALRSRQFLNHSRLAMEECLAFKYDNRGNVVHPGEMVRKGETRDPSGAGVNHGDRVIADALAWKMAAPTAKIEKKKEEERVPLLSLAYRRQLADNERRDEEEDW